MLEAVHKLNRVLEKVVSWLLFFSVLAMLFLTLFSIILRWFEVSLLWIDPIVRHIVFLSAFLGGILAVGYRKHIAIDIVGIYLGKSDNKRLKKGIQIVTDLVALVTLVWLAIAGVQFVQMETEFGKTQFLGIHSSALVSFMPIGFFLMALRYATGLITFAGKEES